MHFQFAEAPQSPFDPCAPNPCGRNSNCRVINNHAVCSCQVNFIGNPPNCRPECVASTDCALPLACMNNRCQDPCPGTCGQNARCQVVNHSPICSCAAGYSGDPFVRCFLIPGNKNIQTLKLQYPNCLYGILTDFEL